MHICGIRGRWVKATTAHIWYKRLLSWVTILKMSVKFKKYFKFHDEKSIRKSNLKMLHLKVIIWQCRIYINICILPATSTCLNATCVFFSGYNMPIATYGKTLYLEEYMHFFPLDQCCCTTEHTWRSWSTVGVFVSSISDNPYQQYIASNMHMICS